MRPILKNYSQDYVSSPGGSFRGNRMLSAISIMVSPAYWINWVALRAEATSVRTIIYFDLRRYAYQRIVGCAAVSLKDAWGFGNVRCCYLATAPLCSLARVLAVSLSAGRCWAKSRLWACDVMIQAVLSTLPVCSGAALLILLFSRDRPRRLLALFRGILSRWSSCQRPVPHRSAPKAPSPSPQPEPVRLGRRLLKRLRGRRRLPLGGHPSPYQCLGGLLRFHAAWRGGGQSRVRLETDDDSARPRGSRDPSRQAAIQRAWLALRCCRLLQEGGQRLNHRGKERLQRLRCAHIPLSLASARQNSPLHSPTLAFMPPRTHGNARRTHPPPWV